MLSINQLNSKAIRKQSIDKGRQGILQIDKAIEEVFEANISGKITDERFVKMNESYEKEKKDLLASVEKQKGKLNSVQKKEVDLGQLPRVLRKFTEVKKLTPETVNILMKLIEVHGKEKVKDSYRVKVEIYLTGVVMVNIPIETEIKTTMKGNTAKPQAGNYIIKQQWHSPQM